MINEQLMMKTLIKKAEAFDEKNIITIYHNEKFKSLILSFTVVKCYE